jgi:erythromycin esterase
MRKALGDDLRIFGFAFARGGFQAVGMGSNQGEGLRDFRVEAPPVGSLDELLDEAVRERRAGGEPAAAWLVDLAALPADGPVAEWFAEPRRARSFGAGFDEARPDAFASAQVQTDAYDALLFVPATTAARANPGVSRGATEVAPAVANLGFEDDPPGAEGGPGGAPAGWTLGQRVNLSATATVSEDGCPEGRRCLRLSRPAGPRYGEAPARLTQRVDATAWRGRRLRLTASAHHRAGEEASAAYLGLRAHSASAGFFTRPVETEAPLADGDWATVELELDVPEDAESVEIGLSLVGAGDAWLDGVEVEDVGPVAAAGGETAAGGD